MDGQNGDISNSVNEKQIKYGKSGNGKKNKDKYGRKRMSKEKLRGLFTRPVVKQKGRGLETFCGAMIRSVTCLRLLRG